MSLETLVKNISIPSKLELSITEENLWTEQDLWVEIKKINLKFSIPVDDIVTYKSFTDPFGDTGLMVVKFSTSSDDEISDYEELCTIFISPNDLAFEPDTSDTGLEFDIPCDVTNMPEIVGYSELLDYLEKFETFCETEKNLARVIGTLIMIRYFIDGLKRLKINVNIEELLKKWNQLRSKVGCW